MLSVSISGDRASVPAAVGDGAGLPDLHAAVHCDASGDVEAVSTTGIAASPAFRSKDAANVTAEADTALTGAVTSAASSTGTVAVCVSGEGATDAPTAVPSVVVAALVSAAAVSDATDAFATTSPTAGFWFFED